MFRSVRNWRLSRRSWGVSAVLIGRIANYHFRRTPLCTARGKQQNGSRKIGQPTTETIGPSHDDTEDGNGNGKKATPVLAGAANAEPANPKKVIKLDDKDFGKF